MWRKALSRFAGWLAAGETMESVLASKRGGLSGKSLKRYLKEQEPMWTISTTESVGDALQKMLAHRIGALIVVEYDTLRGIATDRDLLKFMRKTANARYPLETTPVTQIMTEAEHVVCVTPKDTRQQAVDIMKARGIRHLPVVRGESPNRRLAGIVSVADLLHTAPSDQSKKFRESLHPEGLMFIKSLRASPERQRVTTKWTRC